MKGVPQDEKSDSTKTDDTSTLHHQYYYLIPYLYQQYQGILNTSGEYVKDHSGEKVIEIELDSFNSLKFDGDSGKSSASWAGSCCAQYDSHHTTSRVKERRRD